MNRYDDIINLPHHVSPTRQRMSMHDRAARFAPFAALDGYDEAVAETARLTESRPKLDEQEQRAINERFAYITNHIHEQPEVRIKYFVLDEHKSGGAIIVTSSKVKKNICSKRNNRHGRWMCYSYYRCDRYCDIDRRTRSSCGLSGFGVPPEYRKSETFFLSEVFKFALFDPVGWSVSQDAAFEFLIFPLAVFIEHLFGSCHTAVHIIYPAEKPIVHSGVQKLKMKE